MHRVSSIGMLADSLHSTDSRAQCVSLEAEGFLSLGSELAALNFFCEWMHRRATDSCRLPEHTNEVQTQRLDPTS